LKCFYTYEEFIKDIETLENEIKKFNPDTFLAIARGGMTIAHFLAERLNIRDVYVLNAISYENEKKLGKPKIFNIPDLTTRKKVLIIDDISDSGETLNDTLEVLKKRYQNTEFKTLTLFYKEKTKLIPDITLKKTDKWIVFFWNNTN
jgi:xanthine phosphoribosyltransferase